ncbi:MAG TPA: hypothetical protein PKD51_11990 [Saprospiraceae bacterium]|mgnify:CR=1 FL=1|nr:hypothetical protein [Saprospiraceae bacterium]HMU03476.1 hypothetical protein [Saprospiraceae bacterium]
MKLFFYLLMSLFVTTEISAQVVHLHLNINEAMPINSPSKGIHRYWYNDSTGINLGGVGLGISLDEVFNNKYSVKYQANFSTNKFYDESIQFTDIQGNKLTEKIGETTNLNFTFHSIVYSGLKKEKGFLFGIGAGLKYHISSKSDYGDSNIFGLDVSFNFDNESTKILVLMVPLEIRYYTQRLNFALRTEIDVTKTSHLESLKKERFITLNFEVGYQIQTQKSKKN